MTPLIAPSLSFSSFEPAVVGEGLSRGGGLGDLGNLG